MKNYKKVLSAVAALAIAASSIVIPASASEQVVTPIPVRPTPVPGMSSGGGGGGGGGRPMILVDCATASIISREDGIAIVAQYDGNRLANATKYDVTAYEEVLIDVEAGDKIMLWNEAMEPVTDAVTVTENMVATPAPDTTPEPTDIIASYKFDFGSADSVEEGYYSVTKNTHYNSNIVDGLQFGLLGTNADDYKLNNYVDGVDQKVGQVIVLADAADGEAIGGASQDVANYKVPGDYPIRFAMKAENNHFYKVALKLTTLDDTKPAKANVTSERRRAIVMDETIEAGQSKVVEFTATVQNNYYKGPAITYKDDMLNIVAVGDNLAVEEIIVNEVGPRTTVWMYDDSTGCDYPMLLPYFPLQNYGGTGGFLSKYLPIDVAVSNQGEGGLNAADNMHWGCAKGNIKAGDYVYVQYGHNHKTGGVIEYLQAIPKYYEYASSVGAYTIFAGPIDRHNEGQYDASTNTWSSSLGGFSEAAKYYTQILITGGKAKADEFVQKAKDAANGGTSIADSVFEWADELIAAGITENGVKDVAFVDLNQPTLDWLEQVCEDVKAIRGADVYERNATDYYFRIVRGEKVDGTHPNDAGADNTASFFFNEAKNIIADIANPVAQVQADVLKPLVTDMRDAEPYTVPEEVITAGYAGGAAWPEVYVPDNLPELPAEIKNIEIAEDGSITAVVATRAAKVEMGAYGIVVITVYDENGNEKGKLYAGEQVDNTVIGGTQTVSGFTGDVTIGENDTYKAIVLKAVDDPNKGLIVDEADPAEYSAVFEPTDIESYLITDEDGNGTEDFEYYGAIYEGETVTDLNGKNGWIVGGSASKETTLGVDGGRYYANFIAQNGNSAYVMKKFASAIGTTGRYMLEADLQYVSGAGMKVTFAGGIKNSSPFASDEIELYTIGTNGAVTVNGVEAGALNTNSWATVRAILDMDAGTVSVSVAGGTPVVAEIANYAKFTSDITPTSLAGISFNASKTNVGIRISNMTAAKLYDDKAKATVTASSSDNAMGNVYIGETGTTSVAVLNGTYVSVTAASLPGYLFDSWTIDGVEFSKDETTSIRAYKNINIVANFVVETKSATVTVNYLDGEGNSIKTADVITTDADGDLLRSGNAYTLSDAYKDSIKLSSAENAGLYNVYTFDSAASGSFEIASLAENNVINVVFAKVDGLYYDYETFSNVTDDWGFVEGRSGNVNVLADGTLQLYAGSGTSGSQQKSDVKTLDASIAAATKLTVGFDWKCTSDKNRSSLFNLTDANDNIILSLYGGGTDGSYYKVGAAAAKTDTKIASSSKNEWLRVELNIDFEANIVSGKIINLTKNTEYAIPQTVITADNLAIMKTAYGYSAAPQVIDNVFFKANTEESSTGTLQVDKNVGSVEGNLGEEVGDSLFF